MSKHVARSLGAIVALVAVVYACSGGPGSGTAPSAGGGATAPMTHFRTATSAEKSQNRPSLSAGSRVAANDSRGNPGYYTLVTSLATDDHLNFREWSPKCSPLILPAPWYVALANFSLPVPTTTLPVCAGFSGETPTPSPTPTISTTSAATYRGDTASQSSGLYIIKIDIGFLLLNVDALSGPATTANNEWTFTPDESETSFQFANFYSFFVAQWTPGSASSPSPTPTPTAIPTGV